MTKSERTKSSRRRAKPQRGKRRPKATPEGDRPSGNSLLKQEEIRTTLRQKMKLKEKYEGLSPEDFSRWRYQKQSFWYNHELAYRQDRKRRNALMKNVADTANSYMRIRKAIGLKEYDWIDNGPFFFHMSLSSGLWRKSVKQMVDKRLKTLSSATQRACRKGRNLTVCRPETGSSGLRT